MALKLTCPHCSHPHRLSQPYPVPGTELQCRQCGRVLSVSYPTGMMQRLKEKGVKFVDPTSPVRTSPSNRRTPPPPKKTSPRDPKIEVRRMGAPPMLSSRAKFGNPTSPRHLREPQRFRARRNIGLMSRRIFLTSLHRPRLFRPSLRHARPRSRYASRKPPSRRRSTALRPHRSTPPTPEVSEPSNRRSTARERDG